MAFRLLRQYSEQTQEAKTEFDVDGTVRETCDNAGTLSVCYKRPRKNTVKVLMLMDSGVDGVLFQPLLHALPGGAAVEPF